MSWSSVWTQGTREGFLKEAARARHCLGGAMLPTPWPLGQGHQLLPVEETVFVLSFDTSLKRTRAVTVPCDWLLSRSLVSSWFTHVVPQQ